MQRPASRCTPSGRTRVMRDRAVELLGIGRAGEPIEGGVAAGRCRMIHHEHPDIGPEGGLRPGEGLRVPLDPARRRRVVLAEVDDAERVRQSMALREPRARPITWRAGASMGSPGPG